MNEGYLSKNWLGNVIFNHRSLIFPTTEHEVVSVIKQAKSDKKQIRVVGSAHSWTPLCQTDDVLISLDKLSGIIDLDTHTPSVKVYAGTRLKDLNKELWEKGFSLINLGSIEEQSIAGVVSTATHGTGINFGNLASVVNEITLVDGNGNSRTFNKDADSDIFNALPVSMGLLGVVVSYRLAICSKFFLEETRIPKPFDEALASLDVLLKESDHAKLWWFPHTDVIQTYSQKRIPATTDPPKSWNPLREDSPFAHAFFQFLLWLGKMRVLVPYINKFITLVQFKQEVSIGRSYKKFTMVVPPRHHESEYAIPVEKAAECVKALRKMIVEKGHKVNFVSEIRFVKSDNLWLSPAFERDVCYVGGYFAGDEGFDAFLNDYEQLMHSFKGRPHWGKEFSVEKNNFRRLYPKWDDFLMLRNDMDPDNLFINCFLKKIIY